MFILNCKNLIIKYLNYTSLRNNNLIVDKKIGSDNRIQA